ncbi:MAG: hypothetical protein GYA33_17060 [Thermogutta sp.]|nr:hypothetical protein [Thermogutta sp.]
MTRAFHGLLSVRSSHPARQGVRIAARLLLAGAMAAALLQPSAAAESALAPLSAEGYRIVAVDPEGHGVLLHYQGKQIVIVDGGPREMGTAQGRLLAGQVRYLVERVVYGVGAADSLAGGVWFLDTMAQIEKRTAPHVPARYIEEIDALSQAAGVSIRDGRYANFFPERFHCSGAAVRGKASADGSVVHARVLDYMRDIRLQTCAAVQVFLPDGRHAWMSLGYAGFVGTVTAMNEKGLAVGEMGGRGEGDWDGLPMSLLLREIMERAATVEEALEILRQTPRTCEYYYVFSDRERNLAAVRAVPDEVLVLRPGEQHPLLPPVPEDTVFLSGDRRAEVLSERLHQQFGRIDAAAMIEIIKRPVAMSSNLHNAVMQPEKLDMWVADAGRSTPACDEPYVLVNLGRLLEFYRRWKRQPAAE